MIVIAVTITHLALINTDLLKSVPVLKLAAFLKKKKLGRIVRCLHESNSGSLCVCPESEACIYITLSLYVPRHMYVENRARANCLKKKTRRPPCYQASEAGTHVATPT